MEIQDAEIIKEPTPPVFDDTTLSYKATIKDNPKDRIEVVIGDDKDLTQVHPQIKIQRWDNEVNAPIRYNLPGLENQVVTQEGEKIVISEGTQTVKIYDKPDVSEDGGAEFEIHLASPPATNTFSFTVNSKNLNWFYQPALTQEEIDEGAQRPENVVGSYAVYHATKGGMNDAAGMEYKVGKAFHVYRPQAIDAKGNKIWGEFNQDVQETGILTMTFNKKWLDNAVYPVVLDPTFGYTSQGASDQVLCSRYDDGGAAQIGSSITGDLTAVSAYVKKFGTPANTVYVRLYSDDGGGLPNSSLAGSTALSLTTSYALKTASLSYSMSGSSYHAVAFAGALGTAGSGTYIAYDSGGSGQSYYAGSWASFSGNNYSVYATYTAGGGTDVTVNAGVVTSTSSLPAPTVTAVKNVSVSAGVVTATSSLPAPTVTTTKNVSVSSDVVTATASLPTPTITAVKNVSVSADVVTATSSLPEPTVTAGACTTLVDNFDSYSTGNLAGQGSWTGDTPFQVENSVSQTASNAVSVSLPAAGVARAVKSFCLESAGVQTFYMRGSATTSRGILVLAETSDSNNNIIIYWMVNASKVGYYSGGVVDFATVTNNQWYKIDIEWRSTPDKKFRMRVDDGTWGSFVAPYASWTNGLDTVALDVGAAGSGTVYWDSFNDPNAGATNVSVSADVVTATSSLPAPTITAIKNVSISSGVLTSVTSLPSPTISTSSNVSISSGVVTSTISLPTPTIQTSGEVTVSPNVLTATSSLPNPTINTESNVSISSDVVTSTTSLPTPTVIAIKNVSISSGVLTATAFLPEPTVSTATNVSISPDVVTATSSLPDPTVSVDEENTADVVTGTFSLPAPSVSTGTTINAEVLSLTTSIPSQSLSVEGGYAGNASWGIDINTFGLVMNKKSNIPTWTTSSRPTGRNGLFGFNRETGSLEIYNSLSASWSIFNANPKITVSSSEPSTPATGDLWVDVS